MKSETKTLLMFIWIYVLPMTVLLVLGIAVHLINRWRGVI